MKKIVKILLMMSIIMIGIKLSTKVKASDTLIKNSKSGICIEVETGTVLYEYEADITRFPASTTKIMTIKLIFDAIKNNKIKLNQLLTTSNHASSMGGSKIFLSPNEQMSVGDLLKAVVIASANDAAVVLAEAICGTEENFVKLMNDEAKRLKMNNTNYKNVTGLHDSNHYTSARDLSIISRELLLNYEEDVIKFTSTYEDYLRKDSANPFWLVNTNKLIKRNYGIDGLKTGWTTQAGYCLVATKKENNMRVISVVLGCDNVDDRSEDTLALLNYSFSNYEKKMIVRKGTIIESNENILFNPKNYNIILSEDITKIIKKNDELKDIKYEVEITNLNNNYLDIGNIKVYIDGVFYNSYKLQLDKKREKASFINLLKTLLNNIF